MIKKITRGHVFPKINNYYNLLLAVIMVLVTGSIFIGTVKVFADSTSPVGDVQLSSAINIVSPNGGEQWGAGSTYSITWIDTSPISMICNVGVSPCGLVQKYDISYTPVGATTQNITTAVSGTSYNWTIPSSQAIGSYSIKVCKTGTTTCSTSNSFSIVAAGNGTVSSSPQGGGGGQLYYPVTVAPTPTTPTTPVTPTTPPTPVPQVLAAEKFHFTLYLMMGIPYKMPAQVNEVTELQKFLNVAGYYPGPIDGKFSATLKAAVVEFQLANNLVGDGIIGPLTRAALNK
ncbi:MAG: peptidoglycan-binding domain-containing protein [Candidatus Pacebacteria bacterium]|nr:peptidoglycan-binding domain-containing protein [Candidatus Paceibacterota bacterium]